MLATRRATVARHVLFLTLQREGAFIRAPSRSNGVSSLALQTPSREDGVTQGAWDIERTPKRSIIWNNSPNSSSQSVILQPSSDVKIEQSISHFGYNDTGTIWDIVLGLAPDRAMTKVQELLANTSPLTSISARHAYLLRLRALIDHLSPKGQWARARVTSERHDALQLLWAEWLESAETLRTLGALPRPRGNEGRHFRSEAFTPLLHSLVQRPPRLQSLSQDDARQRLHISRVLEFMESIEASPTIFQLQLVLQHVPVPEVLSNVQGTCTTYSTEGRGLAEASQHIAAYLVPRSDPLAMAYFANDPPRAGGGRHLRSQQVYLELTAGEKILGMLEDTERRGIAVPTQWKTTRDEMSRLWLDLVHNYVDRVSALDSGRLDQPYVIPTKIEVHALWLLLRDCLLGSSLRSSHTMVSETSFFDFHNPLDLLRLSLGFSVLPNNSSSKVVRDVRIVSNVIRVLIYYARNRTPASVLELVTTLVGESFGLSRTLPVPPLPPRTLAYMLGSCRSPSDLVNILPVLEHPNIRCQSGGMLSPRLKARLFDLAHRADTLEPLKVSEGKLETEKKLNEILARWKFKT